MRIAALLSLLLVCSCVNDIIEYRKQVHANADAERLESYRERCIKYGHTESEHIAKCVQDLDVARRNQPVVVGGSNQPPQLPQTQPVIILN